MNELDKLKSLKTFALSEKGEYIIQASKDSVINSISVLINSYKDSSRDELVSVIAGIKANFDIYKMLSDIDDNIKALESLLEK